MAKKLEADYVLVIFGGFANFAGDDMNKFIWMARIANTYFPKIKDENYLTKKGVFI